MKELIEEELLPILERSIAVGKWKRYEEHNDSGVEWIGKIPNHWTTVALKRNSLFISRGNGPEYVDDSPIKIINQACIQNDGIHLEHIKYQRECDISNWKGLLHQGDVLINSTGTGTLGRTSIFSLLGTWMADSHVTIIRPKPQQLSNYYLRYLLQTPLYQRYIYMTMVSGSTNQIELSREQLCSTPILLPSLLEQQAIATFLDRETTKINDLIAKKERMIELLQERRTAIINRAITKGLNPDVPMKDSGVEWLGEIPAHWEVRRLKYLTSFITSGSRGWAQYYSDYGAVFLRIGNLSRASIWLDLSDIQHVLPPNGAEGQRTKIHQNDVLISITAYIGSVAVVTMDIGEAYISQHIALTRPRTNIINTKWLGYFLLSKLGQDQFQLSQYGGTKDGLSLDDIKNLGIVLPPLSEQNKLVIYIEEETTKIDKLISVIGEAIKKLKEYNTALISAAVTGKIDVRGELADTHAIEETAL